MKVFSSPFLSKTLQTSVLTALACLMALPALAQEVTGTPGTPGTPGAKSTIDAAYLASSLTPPGPGVHFPCGVLFNLEWLLAP